MPPACAHGAAEPPRGPSIRRATGVPWPSMTTDAYAPTVDATTAAVGRLAVRALRAVFASDGPVDAEEARAISCVVAALGLPDAEIAALRTEAPVAIDKLDVYGELEGDVTRALLRGAWLAAAWDAIDPRE